MKSKLIVFAASLLVAALATHALVVLFMPEMLLSFVVRKLPGEVNRAFHSPRITNESRRIVRPSPDLLYSICPYDLAAGETLQISALPPADTYISLALYDESTNNYILLNRQDLSAGSRLTLNLIYAPEASDSHDTSVDRESKSVHSSSGDLFRRVRGSDQTVLSPTRKGVALFRILLKAPEQYETLRAFQETQDCRFIAAPAR